MRQYPRCERWDALDCLAHFEQMLALINRRGFPQIAPEDNEELKAAEYESLKANALTRRTRDFRLV